MRACGAASIHSALSAASTRSGVIGCWVSQTPVASWMAAATAGGSGTSGISATPRAPNGPWGSASSRTTGHDLVRHIERGRQQVGAEVRRQDTPVARLEVLQQGVADRLGQAALDLALHLLPVDGRADVVDADDPSTRTWPVSVLTSTSTACAA